MPASDPYLLGHHAEEWSRLDAQHAVWRDAVLEDLRAVGLCHGLRVLDVGCGPGSLLTDLAAAVGSEGRVVGLERDPAAVAEATRRTAACSHVQVVQGDLLDTPLGERFDLVICRWVLSFIDDVPRAVKRLAEWVDTEGTLFVQDYDHDGIRLWPDDPRFHEVIAAFRSLYRRTGGNLWVALDLPEAMQRAGLRPGPLLPRVLAGRPGEPAWLWISRFLREHLPNVVEAGELSESRAREFLELLDLREHSSSSLIISPIVMGVCGRRP